MKSFGERLADILIADGVLTQKQLDEVLELQKKQGGRLLKLLLEKQFVTDQDMMVSMARCLGTPPVTLAKMHVPQDVLELVPKDMAMSYKMAAVAHLGKRLYVAMADPLNVLALDDLRRARPNTEIIPLISTEKAVNDFLNNARTQATGTIDANPQGRRGRRRRVGQGKTGGNQSRPARREQRRRAGHQAGQPHAGSGDQGPRQRYPHRTVRESNCGCATASTACSTIPRAPPKSLQSAISLAHQNHGQPRHRRAAAAAGRTIPHQAGRPRSGPARFRSADGPRRKDRHARAGQGISQPEAGKPGPGCRRIPEIQRRH